MRKKIIQELFKHGIRVYHSKKASTRDIVEEFTENHLLSCIHSNYFFNMSSNSLNISFAQTDITEIIAGAMPGDCEFEEHEHINEKKIKQK